MKTQVAIYDSHEKAIKAIEELNKNKFPMKHVTLLGQAEVVDDHIHIKSIEGVKASPLLVGVGAGTIVGILTGIGVFAIPGFGFLYGAGALIGAFAGLDFGILTGGLGTILTNIGMKKDHIIKFNEHLKEGKFLVVVNGPKEEVDKAKEILHAHGEHSDYLE